MSVDPSLVGTSLRVDLIGANKLADVPKWEAYSINEYWQPANGVRDDANKETMQFGRGHPETQSFTSDNPLWKGWLATGALYLIVIAELPGSWTDRPGNADPRRISLPLDKGEWPKNTGTIELTIQQSGIRLLTPKKP